MTTPQEVRAVHRRFRPLALVVWAAVLVACAHQDQRVIPLDFASSSVPHRLEALGRALGGGRIVLLGENGHGVGEFTEAKVALTRWLHSELGFEVVVMESGFFECGHVWRTLERLRPRDALFGCLRYPFQHREILPLFQYLAERRTSDRPLKLAGMDIQSQGFDSEPRPNFSQRTLAPLDPHLADRVAALDSALFLPSASGGLQGDRYRWAHEHAEEALGAYRDAGDRTGGWASWGFRLAEEWIERLALRGAAELAGEGRPAAYYQIRDRGMARAVAALADSIDGPRKVVVWLHNDHARYGDFAVVDLGIRSVAGLLREEYGDEVFSVGFFLGSGVVTDNGRNERDVARPGTGGIEHFLHTEGSPAMTRGVPGCRGR